MQLTRGTRTNFTTHKLYNTHPIYNTHTIYNIHTHTLRHRWRPRNNSTQQVLTRTRVTCSKRRLFISLATLVTRRLSIFLYPVCAYEHLVLLREQPYKRALHPYTLCNTTCWRKYRALSAAAHKRVLYYCTLYMASNTLQHTATYRLALQILKARLVGKSKHSATSVHG